jgi:hypothetical protein
VDRSIQAPSRSRTHRLASWLATIVLAGALGAVAAGAPAAAAAGDPYYQPRCYNTLCLVYNYQPFKLTAWSLYDVGPTPYYISVFDVATGERLGVCGFGTECTTSPFGALTLGGNCFTYIAYIGGPAATMPPAPVLRTSAVLQHCFGAG